MAKQNFCILQDPYQIWASTICKKRQLENVCSPTLLSLFWKTLNSLSSKINKSNNNKNPNKPKT